MLAVFVLAGFQIGGFARYIYRVTTPTAPVDAMADGIVVLTGGENRIHAAMMLLAAGKSKKLLITGVNPSLSPASLRKSLAIDNALFDCCVEVDHTARDTIGNALVAGTWARKTGAKSLIVVTGAFHMPRAMKELGHATEGVDLIASSVNVPLTDEWWKDQARVRDMLREYAKLVIVSTRDYVNGWTGTPWPKMPMYEMAVERHLRDAKLADTPAQRLY